MGMLAMLIKTVIGAALLDKAVRNAFIASLVKTMNWILHPSTISRPNFFTSLFKGAAELVLLRFAKRSGFSGTAALSVIAALLLAMMKGREEHPDNSRKKQKDQVIDIEEYTIFD
jgi:hypothetical protein